MGLTSRVGRALNDARWRHGVFWPLLVSTRRPWEEYLAALSESGRRYRRKAAKLNSDKAFAPAPFRPEEVRRFMDLWGRHFAFAPDYFDRLLRLEQQGRLACYAATAGGQTTALQLVEAYGPYGRCHAPWFDKDAHEESSLATYMWFSVIEHAVRAGRFEWLDLGGGPLSRLPEDHYKRRYGPDESGTFLRRCAPCGFMFVVDLARLRRAVACPSCGDGARVSWRGRAVLALSRVPKPGPSRRARTRRSA